MLIRITQVDAFTGRAFSGNPAGVCLLDAAPPDAWMQAVAAEMNLAETAFVVPGGDDLGLRWFTPTVEVDLCGHATLASAHVLWEEGRRDRARPIRFLTRSGPLTADSAAGRITLDFPAEVAEACPPPPGLADLIGGRPAWVGRNRMDWLVEVESAAVVRTLDPDPRGVAALGGRGLIVTAPSDEPSFDFVSRFFAPNSGVVEDPATGSSHCALGPHWSGRLGRVDLLGAQLSRRGGEIGVSVRGDRVVLSGRAVTVLRCELAEAAGPGVFPESDR